MVDTRSILDIGDIVRVSDGQTGEVLDMPIEGKVFICKLNNTPIITAYQYEKIIEIFNREGELKWSN